MMCLTFATNITKNGNICGDVHHIVGITDYLGGNSKEK